MIRLTVASVYFRIESVQYAIVRGNGRLCLCTTTT